MLKLDGTCKEFDDFWNLKINPSFDEIREFISSLDLKEETIQQTLSLLEKDINILYGELDNIFTNQWKYLARSEEKVD